MVGSGPLHTRFAKPETLRQNSTRFITMGLDNLAGQQSESVSRGKSTHIKFWNPKTAQVGDDIPDDNEHLHKQDYYDAAKRLRDMYGPAVNIPIGEFMVAAVEAESGNPEPLRDLFDTIVEE